MAKTTKIVADGNSSVTQYLSLLLRHRDLLLRAIEEDAEALRILSAPAFVQRERTGERFEHKEAWRWNEDDENRLNCIRGLVWDYPACRVAKLLASFEYANEFRAALDESRRDNAGAVVAPLLMAAKDAHEKLLEEAHEISQWGTLPIPSQFGESLLDFNQAVSSLMEVAPCPPPKENGPYGSCLWRHNGEVVAGTMQVGAWKMAKHLWGQPDRTASFDELIVPVYGDLEHIADGNAFGSLRKAANCFFSNYSIPWKVSLKKATVSLIASE